MKEKHYHRMGFGNPLKFFERPKSTNKAGELRSYPGPNPKQEISHLEDLVKNNFSDEMQAIDQLAASEPEKALGQLKDVLKVLDRIIELNHASPDEYTDEELQERVLLVKEKIKGLEENSGQAAENK